jgi:hypothetical protein
MTRPEPNSRLKLPSFSVAALSLAALFAPFLGGRLPNDVETLEPGFRATLASLWGGFAIPTLQHAIVGLFAVAAFAYLILKRKIVQVPHAWVSGPLAGFILLLLASVFVSRYRWVSQIALAEWGIYVMVLIAAVGGLGRRIGPMAVLGAISAGTGLVALTGILEYGQMKAVDPTWRIFAGWHNPNALAGVLVVGMLVSFGVLGVSRSQLAVVLSGASATLSGIALERTGSKGGFVALAIGLLFFISIVLAWKRPVAIARATACLLLAGIAVFSIQLSIPKGGSVRALGGGDTQEQSQGFRKQLWKGSVALIRENPIGRGLKTYAFYSAKPGATTRTELAHSTWLQLGTEAGVLAPLALIAMLTAWLWHTFRSARSLPADQNVLRASVVAAVAATVAHGFVESNLYFFGIGLLFFLLLGVGIQLSVDAGAPEFVAPPMRIAAVLFSAICVGVLLYGGYVEKLQANLRWQIASQMAADARQTAATLQGIASNDGETWFRSAFVAGSISEATSDLAKAAEVAPSAKYYRRLASLQIATKHIAEAEVTLRSALPLDPNNLATLKQLMDVQAALGQPANAEATARKLISIEQTPYFKIRALPQVIPTETYEARIFLAKSSPDRLKLLREAVEGLLHFGKVTLPYHRQMQAGGAASPETVANAESKVQIGIEAAKQLQEAYMRAKNPAGEKWAIEALADLEAAKIKN